MKLRNNHFLGINIKHLREEMKLKREGLAAIVGVSVAQISLLERGEIANPGYFLIEALADFFGVEIRSLVNEDLRTSDPVERALYCATNNLGSIELKPILQLIESARREQGQKGVFGARYRHRKVGQKK